MRLSKQNNQVTDFFVFEERKNVCFSLLARFFTLNMFLKILQLKKEKVVTSSFYIQLEEYNNYKGNNRNNNDNNNNRWLIVSYSSSSSSSTFLYVCVYITVSSCFLCVVF